MFIFWNTYRKIRERGFEMSRRKKKRRRKSFFGQFIKIVFSMVLIFVIFAGASIFAYTKISNNGSDDIAGDDKNDSNKVSLLDSLTGKDLKLNVAVLGVDKEETRTDVMFVVHFDSKSGKLALLSVPRDTRVKITNELYEYLSEKGKYIPSGRTCKINEVHAYAGKEKGDYFSVLQMEELLGIHIDNYVKITTDGFRNLVDAVGGVDVDVPQAMNYEDPYQDLYIHLDAGMQHLDGDKAEQLVRFRKYREGDVARVRVQQMFLKELGKKMLSTESIIKNLPSLMKTFYNDVTTDFTLSDCVKYANYVSDISMDNVTMDTLPGEGGYIGTVSYYIPYEDEIRGTVRRVFYDDDVPDAEGHYSSKSKNIEVANGTNKNGYAAENKLLLEEKGYNVTDISTYKGEQEDYTRIVVYKEGLGYDIKEDLYPDAQIIVDTDGEYLSGDADIMVILGSGDSSSDISDTEEDDEY